MKRENFHVGQTVYLFHIGDRGCKTNIEERIIETKVVSIGRKYLKVDYWGKTKMEFDMTDDFREKTIYTPNYQLYLTKEDIYRVVNTHHLYLVVRHKLNTTLSNIPMEGLQEISAIIDKYSEVNHDE